MKKIQLTTVIVLLAIGLMLLVWWWHESGPVHGTTQNSPSAPSASARTKTATKEPEDEALTPAERRRVEEILAQNRAYAAERASTRRLEVKLRQAATPLERRALLGELRDRHYARDNVMRVLDAHLDDPDPGVRVEAAHLLYEFGSHAGKGTLLAVMRSALAPTADTLSDAVEAAQVLNRFREVIPSDLLFELYDKRSHPELLSVMAMQGDPKYMPFFLEAAEEPSYVAGIVHELGVLGVPDGYAFAKQVFASTKNERTKVAAAWAMFRTGGDRDALNFVLKYAGHEFADLKEAPKPDPYTSQAALRSLFVTKDDTVRTFLRQTIAANDAWTSSASLASLFYVQKDYEFVDNYIRNYLSDPTVRTGSSIGDNLIGQMAAARNDPALAALAREKSPEFYNYHFVQWRSVESWIWSYLSDIPLH